MVKKRQKQTDDNPADKIEKNIYHQYDIAYKRLFQHKELVASLLRDFIPQEYLVEFDLTTLEPCPNAYTTSAFRERFNDRVWRIRRTNDEWTYLLIMLEFQSTVDQWMALRILIYTGLLWEGLIVAEQLCNGKLPTVLPIVLYNGQTKWNAPLDLTDLMIPCTPNILTYQARQKYYLLDERQLYKNKVLEQKTQSISACLMRFEQAKDDNILEAFNDLLHVVMTPELLKVVIDWINILSNNRINLSSNVATVSDLEGGKAMLVDEFAKLTEKLINQGRVEGCKEGRQEGRQEGWQEGRQEGRQEGLVTVAKNMLAANLPLEQIVKFTGLTPETIQKLAVN